jgi:peptidyl-dipeptidase A
MGYPTLMMRIFVTALLLATTAVAGEPTPASMGAAVVKPMPAKGPIAATPEQAKAFAKRTNDELKKLWTDAARADWVKNTYITDDTEALSAQASEQLMIYTAAAIKQARRFDGLELDADTARTLLLLKLSADLPAPDDPKKTAELAELASKMTSMYGKGKSCKKAGGKENCRDLEELNKVMSTSRNFEELLEAWNGWHSISPPMKGMYERYVSLANEGAKDIGFADFGTLWRMRYDMAPEAFEQDMDRLWSQVKPLYDDLHCYVRGKLSQSYAGKMKDSGAIPAHLLGNMWAQEWANIYPLVEPFPGQGGSLDVTAALKAKGVDELKLAKMGEEFFVGLGLKPLPKTFWERSMLVKPKDREVVCHASAWDVTYDNDVRIKMCIQVDEDNLITVHHELGHIYYYQYYHNKPVLFQQGAHDGFHEAIGDAVALSVNPTYLQRIGILKDIQNNDKSLINQQMKDALDKVAFLPFGLLMDKWRWDVFSGKTKAADYNKRWWELRRQYQGIEPATKRAGDAFDPGAKYHIPANVPYARYFLARILQFQFHEAMCKAAGHKGALHECSVAGNKAAGKKLSDMLEMGSSKPWPDALEKLTGTRSMDARPLLNYFEPLQRWLKEQNKGKTCGW